VTLTVTKKLDLILGFLVHLPLPLIESTVRLPIWVGQVLGRRTCLRKGPLCADGWHGSSRAEAGPS
jgi:hypothetical protein